MMQGSLKYSKLNFSQPFTLSHPKLINSALTGGIMKEPAKNY